MKYNFRKNLIFYLLVACFLLLVSFSARAASISVTPTTGGFIVDNTFDVSIYLNTEGQFINAVDVSLNFFPDKLQVVSTNIGPSVISTWVYPPRFSNINGTINLQGLIPGGLNSGNALITTIRFRGK